MPTKNADKVFPVSQSLYFSSCAMLAHQCPTNFSQIALEQRPRETFDKQNRMLRLFLCCILGMDIRNTKQHKNSFACGYQYLYFWGRKTALVAAVQVAQDRFAGNCLEMMFVTLDH